VFTEVVTLFITFFPIFDGVVSSNKKRNWW